MANKLAVFKVLLSYPGPNGDIIAPSPVQVQVPFLSETVGSIDVPDGTGAAHVYAVPFGAIATSCTGVLVVNNTENGVNPGTDLGVKINGAAAISHEIPPGGSMFIGFPGSPGATPITALTLTTRSLMVGDGSIAFYLFGDPS